ncbi:hypothetical protein DFH07DRAFT_578738 [Mycena maculata]|uniref:Secreted protein n=1 Tax=Mycena maculata TaxID=230809 RepID=A0AAD7N636_9AGAR|nr:hypothetical protein DFH07DRAFT_578738 [Mycena maculata]
MDVRRPSAGHHRVFACVFLPLLTTPLILYSAQTGVDADSSPSRLQPAYSVATGPLPRYPSWHLGAVYRAQCLWTRTCPLSMSTTGLMECRSYQWPLSPANCMATRLVPACAFPSTAWVRCVHSITKSERGS